MCSVAESFSFGLIMFLILMVCDLPFALQTG